MRIFGQYPTDTRKKIHRLGREWTNLPTKEILNLFNIRPFGEALHPNIAHGSCLKNA
jgi:hypothetical protein